MLLIDLKKTYSRVARDLSWWVLGKKDAMPNYIDVVKDICNSGLTKDI